MNLSGNEVKENKDNENNVKVSVVLPTYNEAKNISTLIQRIDSAIPASKEILVVDDDSPDRTWEIAREAAKKYEEGVVKVIRRINKRKLVTAIQEGIDAARGDYVVWMDADLSMPPEVIPELIKELKIYDIAVGSRYVRGGSDKRPLLRIVSSRIMNLITNVILNFKIRDYDSGFVAARREVLAKERLNENCVYGDYCIELLYKAGKKGYRIKEVPYSFVDRRAGESKTADTLLALAKYGWLYFKKVIKIRMGRS